MRNKAYDCHHCIPTSRNHKLKKVPWNRVTLRRNIHAAYHIICGNRLPVESLLHICRIFVPKEALAFEPEAVEELKKLLGG